MGPSQSKHPTLTPQWNVKIPYKTHQFRSSLHRLEWLQFVVFDMHGSFQFKNIHFLAEVTQIQPCTAVSFLHHTVESTLHVTLWPQQIWAF